MAVLCLIWGASACAAGEAPPERSTSDFTYIDNGKIRLGFKRSSGVGIAYFSQKGGGNVINHWDRGRLVQQSYYGKEDGSTWTLDGKVIPWRWNPVQGGDCRNNPAKVLDVKAEPERLYSKSVGRNWGGCEDLNDVIFEQWASLEGDVAHVKFRMSYSGETTHPEVTHELPAVFIEPHFRTLLNYDGDKPWTSAPVSRSVPGWPNESRKIGENWAAYVDENGVGVGGYVPVASEITCYRYTTGGESRKAGACSYFAPVKKFAITPGLVFTYDVYMTIGTGEEIRERFYGVRDKN